MAKTKSEIRDYLYNLGFTKEDVDPAFLKAVLPGLLNDDGTSSVVVRELSPAEAKWVNEDIDMSGIRHLALAFLTKDGLEPVFSQKELTSMAESIGISKLLPIIAQARKLSSAWTPEVVDAAKKNLPTTPGNDSSTN